MSDGLKMKYFVLKPKGNDAYGSASRRAMRAYATHIREIDRQFSDELRNWADQEQVEAIEAQP